MEQMFQWYFVQMCKVHYCDLFLVIPSRLFSICRCGLQGRRSSLLLRSRARVSLSSIVHLHVLPAPTVASLAMMSLAAGSGIPAYVSSTILVGSLVLQDLLLLPRLVLQALLLLHCRIRTLSVVFVVCSLLQALPRRVLLVLCLPLLAPRDHHLLHSQVCRPRGIWILELLFI